MCYEMACNWQDKQTGECLFNSGPFPCEKELKKMEDESMIDNHFVLDSRVADGSNETIFMCPSCLENGDRQPILFSKHDNNSYQCSLCSSEYSAHTLVEAYAAAIIERHEFCHA